MNKSDEQFDAIIVGGGVAGCAAAIELNAGGWKVALLSDGITAAGLESISLAAVRNLKRYSIWQGEPCTRIVSWWGSENPTVRSSDGARVVDRVALVREMYTVVATQNIQAFQLSRLASLTRLHDIWLLAFDTQQRKHTLRSRYIIDASGRSSTVGRRLGSIRKSSDKLCCLTTTFETATEAGVWTEAVENGWWNLCSGGTRGIVSFFSKPPFLKNVSRDFSAWLSRTSEMKKLVKPPIGQSPKVRVCGSSLLSPCAGPGWLAIGDAAMTLQPLASAGVANALQDAREVLLFLAWNPSDYNNFKRIKYSKYLRALADQYKIENRWPASDFWQS